MPDSVHVSSHVVDRFVVGDLIRQSCGGLSAIFVPMTGRIIIGFFFVDEVFLR